MKGQLRVLSLKMSEDELEWMGLCCSLVLKVQYLAQYWAEVLRHRRRRKHSTLILPAGSEDELEFVAQCSKLVHYHLRYHLCRLGKG